MKKLALIALAGAFALTPVLALAATNTDNSPAQPSAPGYQTYQYGQGRYLHTFSNISMNIPAFCTSVSADDVAFGQRCERAHAVGDATDAGQLAVRRHRSPDRLVHIAYEQVPPREQRSAESEYERRERHPVFDHRDGRGHDGNRAHGNTASPPPLYYVVPTNEAATTATRST